MKPAITFILLLFINLQGTFCSGQEQASHTTLKVLTYNIHHGEGTDGVVDLGRTARLIRESNADLVALQEVDDSTRRTNHVDQTSRLAELTGLHGKFAHQIDFEGGRYGQAILSRYPLSEVTVSWLPGSPPRERRIAAWATVTVPSVGSIVFASTHLHHNNADFRQQQAEELVRLFGSQTVPVIVAGDLNAVPDSEPLKILTKKFQSVTLLQSTLPDTEPSRVAATFPSLKPERQLDYILCRESDRYALTVKGFHVLQEPLASDHLPLTADIVVRQR